MLVGKIDHHDLTKIQWSKLPNHPGTARYRIAAGGWEKDDLIYFSGGRTIPNFNGIGYDGRAAEPSPVTFAFSVRSGSGKPSTRYAGSKHGPSRVGGPAARPGDHWRMEKGQQVTSRATTAEARERKIESASELKIAR